MNSVERARGFLKDRPEPHAAPSKRKSVRARKPAVDEEPEAATPGPDTAEREEDGSET
jgi:hypothetical protein